MFCCCFSLLLSAATNYWLNFVFILLLIHGFGYLVQKLYIYIAYSILVLTNTDNNNFVAVGWLLVRVMKLMMLKAMGNWTDDKCRPKNSKCRTHPSAGFVWLFNQHLCNRCTLLLQIWAHQGAAKMVHSLLMKIKIILKGWWHHRCGGHMPLNVLQRKSVCFD